MIRTTVRPKCVRQATATDAPKAAPTPGGEDPATIQEGPPPWSGDVTWTGGQQLHAKSS